MTRSVLLVGTDSAQSSFTGQVDSAFSSLGWAVNRFNYRYLHLNRSGPTRWAVSKALIRRASSLRPDLVLVIKGDSIEAGTITSIRQLGIKVANWSLDEPFGEMGAHNGVKTIPEYDGFFIFDEHYVKPLEKTGARLAHWLPCCSDPILYQEVVPWHERSYLCDTSFIGSHYPNREQLLTQLADMDLKIWGHRWDTVSAESALRHCVQTPFPRSDNSAADVKEMVRLWNLSRTTINIHHPQSRYNGANLRTFDLMASRSFQLCDTLPGLDTLFSIGKEIVTYSSPEELRRLIQYYAHDDAARKLIVERAHREFLARHTTKHRISEMIDVIGIQK